jgi:RNA polymerase II-associated factor 1
MKRDEQIEAILYTFEAAKALPVHPTNPELTPTEILPVFPDFELWPNIYSQIVFDRDPAPTDTTPEEAKFAKLEAIVKGFSSAESSFVGYMVPKKRKRESEPQLGDEEEYEWIREYSYNMKKGSESTDSYFFTFTQDGAQYSEISTRVNLTKLGTKLSFLQPSKITLVHREINESELNDREIRNNQLLQSELLQSQLEDNEEASAQQEDADEQRDEEVFDGEEEIKDEDEDDEEEEEEEEEEE